MGENMIEQFTNVNTGSTGAPGFSYRSYERGYLNYPNGVITDTGVLERLGRIGNEIVRRGRRGVTRVVARPFVTEDVLGEALGSPNLSGLIEAAVPTVFTGRGRKNSPIWMMLGAVNHPSRSPLQPVGEMIRRVDAAKRPSFQSPAERISELVREGYTFIRNLPGDRISEVHRLWENSFEWDEAGVRKLHDDLIENSRRRAADRSVWFTAVIEPGSNRVVSLATAERLDLPIIDGVQLPIIENTEWRRSEETNRHGLVAAAVSHLNAQILEDVGNLHPAIIAETNYRSGAHHVGFASGMEVPTREIQGRALPQMLIQNVRVGDGLSPDGKRDFTMMHLPEPAIQTLYDPASRRVILKGDI